MCKEKNLLRFGVAIVMTLAPVALLTSALASDEIEASAHARSLRGAYGFALTQSCVRTPFQVPPAAGFDPSTLQLLVDGELVSGYGTGLLRFAKDGVVTLEDGFVTEITASQLSAGSKPVSSGTRFGCTGSYSVQPGGRVGVSLSCDVVVPQPGPSVTLRPLNFEGFIGEMGRSINLSTVKPEVHTVTVSSAGTVLQQRERVCLQSMILDKV